MAGATLMDLRSDFFARGFDPMNDGGAKATIVDRWINQSYFELCSREDWPFLFADASGTAPLTIPTLRTVLSVTNTTTGVPLPFNDRRALLDSYGTLTTTGTAYCWYRDSQTTIATYPVDSGSTIAVRYITRPTLLSSGSDAVVVPLEWCDLIVDGAVLRAKKGKDDFDQYAQQFEVSVLRMVEGELQSGEQPDFVEVRYAVDG